MVSITLGCGNQNGALSGGCGKSHWFVAPSATILPRMINDSVQVPKLSLAARIFSLFLRLVAASCLWFGLSYWAMLVGFSMDGAGRFDLLPLSWRAAATALAVVYPVAAIGLWLNVSWGPVVWLLAAGIEVGMHRFFPAPFGAHEMTLLLHGVVAGVFILFRAVLFYQHYKQSHAVRVDLP